MSKVIETKQQVVTEIADKLRASKSTIVVDYRGLTVSEATELRKQLREAGVEFKVYKNSLTRRAAESAEMAELNEFLTGPNAIAFSNEDVVAPAKVLNDEGKLVTLDEVKAIATLPSREGLLSMLLSVLQAPIRNLALATKAVADQKEEQGA